MGFVDRMDKNLAKNRVGMWVKTYKLTNFFNLHLEANSEAYFHILSNIQGGFFCVNS